MKIQAHEKFFIRKGWLYKGLKHIRSNPTVFVDKSRNPMDVLGLGANRVKSLRYWMQATELAREPRKGIRAQTPTDMANLIWDYDKYMEELGTLWLLHYRLACNKDKATAWFYFFNLFNMSEFKKEDFVDAIDKYIRMEYGKEVARGSLENDFECIVNTYLSRQKSNPAKIHPESNIDCPLGELGLLDIVNKRDHIYRKSQPKKNTLPLLVILSIIIGQSDGEREIRIQELLKAPCNIGKTFNLDIITLTNYLYQLSQMGYIKVVRTAGLDLVRILTNMDADACLRTYYQELNMQSNVG